SNWSNIRDTNGEGSIKVLIDNQTYNFTLNYSKKIKTEKIEDILKKSNNISLLKLLIVKSADVKIGENTVSKKALIDIFMPQKVIEEINSKISSTIKNAEILNEIIKINKQGDGKIYYEKKEQLERINLLINKINEKLNPSRIAELEKIKTEIEEKIKKLEEAKRYKAYTISCKINDIENELSKLPSQNEINKIKNLINEYENLNNNIQTIDKNINALEQKKNNLETKKEEYYLQLKAKNYYAYKLSEKLKSIENKLNKFSEESLNQIQEYLTTYRKIKKDILEKEELTINKLSISKHFNWLKAAYEEYSKILENKKESNYNLANIILNILSLLLIISSIMLIALNNKVFIIPIIATILGILYAITKSKKPIKYIELEKIKDEFKTRFNEELSSIAKLNQKLNEAYEAKNYLENTLEREKNNLNNITQTLKNYFHNLCEENVEESQFEDKFKELKEKRKELIEEYNKLQIELAKIKEDVLEFEINNPGVEYSPQKFEELKKNIENLEYINKEIEKLELEKLNLETKQKTLEKSIKAWFKKYNLEDNLEIQSFLDIVNEIEKKSNEKVANLKELMGELNGLEIEPAEFIKIDPGINYSKRELEKNKMELKNIENEINEVNQGFENLKGEIIGLVGNLDRSSNLCELMNALNELKSSIENEYKEITAKIIAGILLYKNTTKLNKEVEKQLENQLNSNELINIVYSITKRYSKFSISNDEIIIHDDINSFPIKDLSTGAKEQVLLGIIIGIIKNLLKYDSAFIILDDAFQHIDWYKRPFIIDSLISLAKNDWQIFYLTMDENIKEIFYEKSKTNPDLFNITEI
ncbi:MAG: hypothetical protein RMJ17_00385, partial [Candidatus Aenigmarchaeota archaeon]|nr:hypothetical protein [Candidatus Aenigmarchaeota archaeon]MDW8149047.1 hypothetical protein [Candidatus Aenigmarchaeota archaeon]